MRPIMYSRSAEFIAIWEDVVERLGRVFQTSGDVLIFGASGTGAMSSAVANLDPPGREDPGGVVRQLRQPLRGDREGRGRRRPCTSRASGAGRSTPTAWPRRSREHPDIEVVFVTQSETSTGRRVRPARAARGGRRPDPGGRRGLGPRRGGPADGRVGDRRRRLRLPEGPDDPAGPRVRRGQRAGDRALRRPRRRRLLPRLGAHPQGRLAQPVHPAGHDRLPAPGGAAAHRRRGPAERLRPPPGARPRHARRRPGDGPRPARPREPGGERGHRVPDPGGRGRQGRPEADEVAVGRRDRRRPGQAVRPDRPDRPLRLLRLPGRPDRGRGARARDARARPAGRAGRRRRRRPARLRRDPAGRPPSRGGRRVRDPGPCRSAGAGVREDRRRRRRAPVQPVQRRPRPRLVQGGAVRARRRLRRPGGPQRHEGHRRPDRAARSA